MHKYFEINRLTCTQCFNKKQKNIHLFTLQEKLMSLEKFFLKKKKKMTIIITIQQIMDIQIYSGTLSDILGNLQTRGIYSHVQRMHTR